MADLLKLSDNKTRIEFAENYNYSKAFNGMGSRLFPRVKSDTMEIDFYSLLQNSNIPVMAKVSAFDAEAPIGDRLNYQKIIFEQLFIKEKINTSEKIDRLLKGLPAPDSKLLNFIFDDMNNMLSRVMTRTELMNMELLATGKITIKENGINQLVDYLLPAQNRVILADWSSAASDILGDLNKVKLLARNIGIDVVRAIISGKMVGYMCINTALKAAMGGTLGLVYPTETNVKSWILANFGIAFEINDDQYKLSANDTTMYRFYPDDRITFLSTNGALGTGLFGVTPEERLARAFATQSEKMFVTVSQWDEPDPVATWTKASAIYLPIPKDINSIIIASKL